ncbi:MAG: FoF1 ATP synthase subunit gamma [bacterium]
MSKVIELKDKARGVTQISKMAEAMQIVAVAELKKIQSRQKAAEHYSRHYRRLVARLGADKTRTIVKSREEVLFVLASERGFCGDFNERLFKQVGEYVVGQKTKGINVRLTLVGRKGCELFSGWPAEKIREKGYLKLKELLLAHTAEYEAGNLAGVGIFFNEFKSMMSQLPRFVKLLPFADPLGIKREPSLLLEPTPAYVRDYVADRYLTTLLYDAYMQTRLGEVVARLLSMRGAAESSKEMLKDLGIKINKARQSMITVELSEIISSFEVLAEEHN